MEVMRQFLTRAVKAFPEPESASSGAEEVLGRSKGPSQTPEAEVSLLQDSRSRETSVLNPRNEEEGLGGPGSQTTGAPVSALALICQRWKGHQKR